MGLFVDIPKPKAWPPPKDPEGIQKLLSYGFRRDPVGDSVHTWIACLFMFCLPLATAPSNISFIILLVYALLRLPSTWRTLTPLCSSTIFRLMVAWAAWTILSIAWSENPYVGWDHARALRMVLLPALLWPVMRHWKLFLGAFLAGVFLQNMVQLSEVVGSWFLNGKDWLRGWNLTSLRGLETHYGKAAMFMGFASFAWIVIIVSSNRFKKTTIICLFISTAGMVSTASISVTVGFILSVFVLIVLIAIKTKISIKHVFISSVMLLALSLVWFLDVNFAYANSLNKSRKAIHAIQEIYDGKVDIENSAQLRLHWWTETLRQTLDEPAVIHGLVGHGLGGVASVDFSKKGSMVEPLAEHIHNSYIQILYENGVIGLVLFLLLLWKMIAISIGGYLREAGYTYPVCASCVVLWSVATFFENSQSSGRPLAMLILLALFIMYQKVERESVKS